MNFSETGYQRCTGICKLFLQIDYPIGIKEDLDK
jgi:hypothetical protein